MEYSLIEGIISSNIFSEWNLTDWNEYKENVLRNFNSIDFTESIGNYVPCQRKLYITRPKMRELLRRFLYLNTNIFRETGYESYESKTGCEITFHNMCYFVEDCVKILAKKQQGK